MTSTADPPGADDSPRGLDALVRVLAAEFPVYVFGTLRTYNGVSLSARHKDGAAGPGLYAVITTDPGEMRRVDRPGKSGGRYVCELSFILPDSSALKWISSYSFGGISPQYE